MKRKILTVIFAALCAAACLFAVGCKKVNKAVFAVEEINYDGQNITWNKIDLADYYKVAINGGEKARSNSTTYAFKSTESFEVTVYTVVDDDEKASFTQTFHPLDKIAEITVSDDGKLSWDSVSGANSYSLTINGQTSVTSDNAYSELSVGSNRVKIKPSVAGDNTYYSFWSDEINVYIYEKPNAVKYDGTFITWMGGAADYEVKINGSAQSVKGNKVNYNSENRDFTVSVKAIGNHSTTYDSVEIQEEFHYLDPVSNVFVENGILKWNEVANAESYRVRIGGVVQKDELTATEYDKLTAGRSMDVSVMPVRTTGNYFSSWSAEKSVYILESPLTNWNNDLELDGEANNNYTWNAVNAAAGYTVRLSKDGSVVEEKAFSEVQLAYPYAFAEVGVYTVEVKANAAGGGNYYDSKYSAPVTVERLASPKEAAENFVVSDKDSLAKGFTVNFVKVNGATGYQLYKDGVLLNGKYTTAAALSDAPMSDDTNMGEQHFTYMVRSMGEKKTVGGGVYVTLPSLTAQSLSFDITVQATPQNLAMSGYDLFWGAVAGNNGYSVAYSGTTASSVSEKFDFSTLPAGTFSIAVSARGNGGRTLASTPSSPITVTRLRAPANIKISSAANGTLDWEEVSNATGYQVFLDLSETALDENAYENMYQFIRTDGTTLTMNAVANKYSDDGTVYYMTSQKSPTQQFIRLAAPVFPEGALSNSVELIWNTPSNINTSEYTPTYRVYSAINEQIGGGDVNGTKFNIEYLEKGDHNFYVKAIGNDVKYLDSDYSEVIAAYKIETPEIRLENGQYVWTSVTNASSYYLEIDGKKAADEFHVSGETYSYTPKFNEAGTHIVKLKALGDGRNNVDSKTFVREQIAAILENIQIEYGYSSNQVVSGGYIYVNVTEPAKNASGYQYEIAGESITKNELSCTKVMNNTGTFSVRVKALGGSFDDKGVYYIDSEYAGGSATDGVVLFGFPDTSSFSVTSDGVIKWKAITGCYGYDYKIAFDDEKDYGDIVHTQYNNVQVENHKQYGKIRILVRASGNGGKAVSSEWVEFVWTNSAI